MLVSWVMVSYQIAALCNLLQAYLLYVVIMNSTFLMFHLLRLLLKSEKPIYIGVKGIIFDLSSKASKWYVIYHSIHRYLRSINKVIHKKGVILRNDLDLETGFVRILTLNIILNGDSSLSEQRNLALHTAVSKYILESDRF